MTTASNDDTAEVPAAQLVSPEILAKTGTNMAELPRVKWDKPEVDKAKDFSFDRVASIPKSEDESPAADDRND